MRAGPKFVPEDTPFIEAASARSPAVAVLLLATLSSARRSAFILDRRCLAGVVLVRKSREVPIYPIDAVDDAFLATATEWHQAGTRLPLSL